MRPPGVGGRIFTIRGLGPGGPFVQPMRRQGAAREQGAATDSLRFNVAQLLQEPFGTTVEHQVDVALPYLSPGMPTSAPLRGTTRFTRTNRGLFGTVNLATRVRLECGRCLAEIDQPMTLSFKEEFHPVIDVKTGLPIPDEFEPDAFRISENHEVDLSEAIRQYAIANEPMRVLCRPDCKGLCLRCGADLNQGPHKCGADRAEPAPRTGLAALQDWLEQNESADDRP